MKEEDERGEEEDDEIHDIVRVFHNMEHNIEPNKPNHADGEVYPSVGRTEFDSDVSWRDLFDPSEGVDGDDREEDEGGVGDEDVERVPIPDVESGADCQNSLREP